MGHVRRQSPGAIPSVLVLSVLAVTSLHAEPEPLRDDLQMRRLVSSGCDVRRIDRDPTTGGLYVLCSNGAIRRVVLDGESVRIESVYDS